MKLSEKFGIEEKKNGIEEREGPSFLQIIQEKQVVGKVSEGWIHVKTEIA